jgi:hypothetical protein
MIYLCMFTLFSFIITNYNKSLKMQTRLLETDDVGNYLNMLMNAWGKDRLRDIGVPYLLKKDRKR